MASLPRPEFPTIVRVEFDAANEILATRLEGRVTEESTLELYQTIRKYMAATGARAVITDYTNATEIAISSGSIRSLASRKPPTTRPRILVLPQTYSYGLGRMYGLLQEPTNPLLQVVHTIDEAFAALGVRSPHFEPLE
jgi:hypothetical protein